MIDSVGAVGARTQSVGFSVDETVSERAGGSVAKAEETAAMPSLKVTDGARNVAAAVVEKAKPRTVRHDDLHVPTAATQTVDDLIAAQGEKVKIEG